VRKFRRAQSYKGNSVANFTAADGFNGDSIPYYADPNGELWFGQHRIRHYDGKHGKAEYSAGPEEIRSVRCLWIKAATSVRTDYASVVTTARPGKLTLSDGLGLGFYQPLFSGSQGNIGVPLTEH